MHIQFNIRATIIATPSFALLLSRNSSCFKCVLHAFAKGEDIRKLNRRVHTFPHASNIQGFHIRAMRQSPGWKNKKTKTPTATCDAQLSYNIDGCGFSRVSLVLGSHGSWETPHKPPGSQGFHGSQGSHRSLVQGKASAQRISLFHGSHGFSRVSLALGSHGSWEPRISLRGLRGLTGIRGLTGHWCKAKPLHN